MGMLLSRLGLRKQQLALPPVLAVLHEDGDGNGDPDHQNGAADGDADYHRRGAVGSGGLGVRVGRRRVVLGDFQKFKRLRLRSDGGGAEEVQVPRAIGPGCNDRQEMANLLGEIGQIPGNRERRGAETVA